MSKYLQPQIKAIKMGIAALEKERRRFSTGNYAYRHGVRKSVYKGDISGEAFGWVEEDRQKFLEYCEAIRQLEDMIEILEDEFVFDEATQHGVHPTPVRVRQNRQPVIVENQLELPVMSG